MKSAPKPKQSAPVKSPQLKARKSKALTEPILFPPPVEQQAKKERKPRKIDTILFGSSIVKHIKGGAIKRKSGKYVKVCSFPGADMEKSATTLR